MHSSRMNRTGCQQWGYIFWSVPCRGCTFPEGVPSWGVPSGGYNWYTPPLGRDLGPDIPTQPLEGPGTRHTHTPC